VNELAELYVVFVVVYLVECAQWGPRRAVAVLALAGRWRCRRSWSPNASWSRGALFGVPWPPLSPALVAETVPVQLGPRGLLHDDTELVWESVDRVAVIGARVEVNGQPLATLATRRGAAALGALLEKLPRLSPQRREAALARWLDARFDTTTAPARLQDFRAGTGPLRIATNALWVALFLGLPVVFTLPLGGPLPLLALAALVLLLWAVSAVLFERALRKPALIARALWPDLTKRVVAAASPLAAIRSPDLIARELAGDLDPLAVAANLVRAPALGALARPRLVELLFRRDGPAAGAWWRDAEVDRIRRLLRASDVDPDGLLAPPERERAAVIAWCPACLAQYETVPTPNRTCPNDRCAGIGLIDYRAPSS
jgi:hypothetical protein